MKSPNTRVQTNAEALDLDNQILAHIVSSPIAKAIASGNPFKIMGVKEILTAPPPLEWLLEGYILRSSQCQIIGESTIGKTFFSVALGLSIATGRDFMGRSVKQGAVVYINAEGHTGIKWRIKGWDQEFGSIANAPFYLSKQSADFLDDDNIKHVTKAIDAIARQHDGYIEAIMVDTLHRNMHGDENSSEDFGLFMDNLQRLCQRYDAAGIVNHHPGHNAKDRGRGSSSQRASLDSELLLIKQNQQITLKHKKLKDGGPLQPTKGYRLRPVTIPWQDINSDDLTTCVPEFYELDHSNSNSSNLKPISGNLRTAITALVSSLNGAKTTNREHWKMEFSNSYVGKDDAMKKAFSRATQELTKHGVVIEVKPDTFSLGDYSNCPWIDVADYLSPASDEEMDKNEIFKEDMS